MEFQSETGSTNRNELENPKCWRSGGSGRSSLAPGRRYENTTRRFPAFIAPETSLSAPAPGTCPQHLPAPSACAGRPWYLPAPAARGSGPRHRPARGLVRATGASSGAP